MALLNFDFFSNVLGMGMQASIILPESTIGQIGMEGISSSTYPTLYLLHGMSDDHTTWIRRTSIERYVSSRNIAVVMPSTHLGWYTDTTYGMKYFTYLTCELPEICQHFFKGMSDRREDTYIAGLSMGGYGALKAALTFPEKYASAASLSGAVDLTSAIQASSQILAKSESMASYWTGLFGNISQIQGSNHDLFYLAEICAQAEKKPRIFQWCGTEDPLLDSNRKMKNKLSELEYDLTYSESYGEHSWLYWDQQIQNVLSWLDAGQS